MTTTSLPPIQMQHPQAHTPTRSNPRFEFPEDEISATQDGSAS